MAIVIVLGKIVAIGIVGALIFVAGMLQGESQEREHRNNMRRLERMGGSTNENRYR